MSYIKFTPTKALRALSVLSAILVLGLAAGAFTLSYDALRHSASENGISPSLVWIWPLILDGAIVIFSICALRASLYLEPSGYAMFLVIAATAVSITFNALHAPPGISPKIMAGLPPLALFLCFELLIRQIKGEAERNISRIVDEAKKKSNAVPKELSRLKRKTHTPATESTVSKKAEIEQRRVEVARLRNEKSSISEIATCLGVSPKTVERDISSLDEQSRHAA